MVKVKLREEDIQLGVPIAWNIYNARGSVMLKKGLRIHSPDRLEQLLRFELYRDPEEPADTAAQPGVLEQSARELEQHCKHPFDTINNIASTLESSFQALLVCSTDSYLPIIRLASSIRELTSESPDCCLAAVHLYYPQNYSLMQPVYSSIMCALTAQVLGYDRQRTESLCAAALTSNLGMFKFQDELNCQTTPLSEEQRVKISQHPQRSVQMLQASGLDDKEWLEMVLQHHERDDCSGYPFGIDNQVIHPGSKIISLAESYLAMIYDRPYRGPVHPKIALKEIYKLANPDDQTSFLAFIKTLGIFPPGTYVKLENGEIAVVTAHSEKDSLKCRVISIYDKNEQPLKIPVLRNTAAAGCAISNTYEFEKKPHLDISKLFSAKTAAA